MTWFFVARGEPIKQILCHGDNHTDREVDRQYFDCTKTEESGTTLV